MIIHFNNNLLCNAIIWNLNLTWGDRAVVMDSGVRIRGSFSSINRSFIIITHRWIAIILSLNIQNMRATRHWGIASVYGFTKKYLTYCRLNYWGSRWQAEWNISAKIARPMSWNHGWFISKNGFVCVKT